ncbi:substrate-binding periplasmic protein [Litoreibacter roseus]|uniref:Solute-binding protein family 3/N-terminal domain-containing protein n=1 Tax=Litoreibacter roseus TaxID=2601869 RepID=A0A6N6JFM8_9RHOB|nr:transporter substrate-binding domain-containing protein [Litoreibacter roseus]GFE64945.1 hypothetical protein KIN_20190 [Litoreibacter roseus]
MRLIISILAAALTLVGSASAEVLRAVTSADVAPMSRGHDQDLPGFNHELVSLMVERAGLSLQIDYYPWKRAQKIALGNESVLIFGLTRTEKREDQYEWIAPLIEAQRVFVTTGPLINSVEDARNLDNIGAQGVYLDALQAAGFENVEEATAARNLRKLQAGRVSAVYTLAERAAFEWAQFGYSPDTLRIGTPIAKIDLWLCATKGYSKETQARLAAALAEIRVSGEYDALHSKYFGGLTY